MKPQRTLFRISVIFVVMLMVGLSGQAFAQDSSPVSEAAPRTTYPITVENCGMTLTFDKAPERVVTMSDPRELAIIVLLGKASTIVANGSFSSQSEYPGLAEQLDAIEPKFPDGVPAEQMLALKPDFVTSGYGAYWFDSAGGFATREDLAAIGANTYIRTPGCSAADAQPADEGPQTVATLVEQIRLFGQIFDAQAAAASIIADVQGRVDTVAQSTQDLPKERVLVLDIGSVTVTEGIVYPYGDLVNEILTAAGGENVFGEMKGLPEITREEIAVRPVDAYIIITYSGGPPIEQTLDYLYTNFPDFPATINKRFLAIADDGIRPSVASGYGAEKIAEFLHP